MTKERAIPGSEFLTQRRKDAKAQSHLLCHRKNRIAGSDGESRILNSNFLTQRRRDAEAQRRRGLSCVIAKRSYPVELANPESEILNPKSPAKRKVSPRNLNSGTAVMVRWIIENSKLRIENSPWCDGTLKTKN